MGKNVNSLSELYADINKATARYERLRANFEKSFGNSRDIIFISAPGRTEIGGNHTDHQRGAVLAAAVDLDVVCVAAPCGDNVVRIISEGYEPDTINLDDLSPNKAEEGKTAALVRGIAAWFSANNCKIGGFNAYISSDVIGGSGLSSSAAFEVAIGGILNHLYNDSEITPERIAIAGQFAENKYFNKPSGLMDQMASSVGGFVCMDFKDPTAPAISPVEFNLDAAGFTLCVVNTRGSHADLTAEYSAIPREMKAVAKYFGAEYLSEVDENNFYAEIPKIREQHGDRAVLRAMHFFGDNKRVKAQYKALKSNDTAVFLALVKESGESSFSCLQNIYARPNEQGLSVALALSGRLLAPVGGAWRVHGGGFAGTIQAYVPHDFLQEYRKAIDGVFGEGSCLALGIRRVGGTRVLL